MGKKIVLSADSTCDLPKEILEDFDIKSFPYYINLRDKEYKDGVDITPMQTYEAYWDDGSLPKTAAISVGDYLEHFKHFTEEGFEVIHINLGHALSSSYNNACLAAEDLDGVYVVDSCNLSSGTGLMVMRAGRLIKEGKTSKEIVEALEDMKPKIHTSFILDTLDFMAAGGRCPTIAAKAAGMLKCKPYLEVDNSDGSLHMGKMYRGKSEKVLKKYIQDELAKYDNLNTKEIFITNSMGFEDEFIDILEQVILENAPFERVFRSVASCTISSHCGPKCLGILFVTK